MKTVFAYVLVVLGLGVAGSTIVSATPLINTFSQRLSGGYNIVNLIMESRKVKIITKISNKWL